MNAQQSSDNEFTAPGAGTPDDPGEGQVWTVRAPADTDLLLCVVLRDEGEKLVVAPLSVEFDRMSEEHGDFYFDAEDDPAELGYGFYVQSWCDFAVHSDQLVGFHGTVPPGKTDRFTGPGSLNTGIDHVDRYRRQRRREVRKFSAGKQDRRTAGTDGLPDDVLEDVAGGKNEEELNSDSSGTNSDEEPFD